MPEIVATIEEWAKEVSDPKLRQQLIAEYARGAFDVVQEFNKSALGRKPKHKTTVDGRQSDDLERVNPDHGSIVFEFQFNDDVVRWIAQALKEGSPRLSGDYMRGHVVKADGVEIDPTATIPNAREFVFYNDVPYVRKIEIGRTESGRAFVIQVPPRLYARVYEAARVKFPDRKIRYEFLTKPPPIQEPAIILRG